MSWQRDFDSINWRLLLDHNLLIGKILTYCDNIGGKSANRNTVVRQTPG